MSEEGKSISVNLQCPKCGQIMSFNVQRGQDAIAVCDRCQIPMKKLAKIVQSDMELDLEERIAALLVQVGELADKIEDVRELEKRVGDLEKYKANKLFKRKPREKKND